MPQKTNWLFFLKFFIRNIGKLRLMGKIVLLICSEQTIYFVL